MRIMSKRKIYICFLLIMQLCTCCYAQDDLDENRYILWGENMELSLDDFMLKRKPKNAIETAFIRYGFSYSLEQKDKMTINFNVYVYMDREKSWSRYHGVADADSCLSYVLKHEQGHFDIAEIYARECRMLLSQIKANSFEKAEKNMIE